MTQAREAQETREAQEISPGMYKRLTSGAGQFALAIGACLLVVVGVMLIAPGNGILSFGKPRETLPYADPSQGAAALKLTAPYTSYAPQGLPATWRPTSSRLTASDPKKPVSWHLGYATPAGEYAALEESNRPSAAFVAATAPGSAAGVRQVAGAAWTQYAAAKDRALVRTVGTVTLVVTGTASYDELATLAAALQPQPKS